MIRFTMPEPALPMREQITELKEQFDSFLRSEALSELFEVLKTDRDVIGCTPDERVVTCERYDPVHFLQGLIALLDWIERFNQI